MKNFVLLTFFALLFVPQVFAKTYPKLPLPTSTPAPTPTPIVINSFELFWPMVAGKTEVESLYSLKIFKENIRGSLIFSSKPKGDYAVFLGTKRLLEAEKLLTMDKKDAANNTLDRAIVQFKKATSLGVTDANADKISHDKTLTSYLNLKYPNQKLGEISSLLLQLQP